MAETLPEAEDSLVLKLDPGGPIELDGLTESFAALARMYARYYRETPDGDPAPKLYVTRLETGSIVATIIPLLPLLAETIPYVSAVNTVAEFTKRVSDGIRAFCGLPVVSLIAPPTRDDAADLREFIRPLTGRRGASLGLKHARFIKRDGTTETFAEYTFDEVELNRAALNIERILEEPPSRIETASRLLTEVMLVFDRASRSPGRDKGRATDWTIVAEVTDRPLPTYFRNSIQGDLKDVMVRHETNPLADVGYIVDVSVQMVGDEPKAYIVTAVHATVPLSDGA